MSNGNDEDVKTYVLLERLLSRQAEVDRKLEDQKAATDRIGNAQAAGNFRIDRYARKTRELERVVYHGAPSPHPAAPWRPPAPSLPDPDDTQRNQIEDLQKALAEQKAALAAEERLKRDSVIWWKRQRWQWAAGAVGALAIAGLSALITYVLAHVH